MGDQENNIIYKEIDNKLVAVDVNAAKYYTFNETATQIFNYLKDGLGPDEIAAKMSEEFGVPLDDAQADIATLIKDIKSKNLPLK